jgi:hypothetical protein
MIHAEQEQEREKERERESVERTQLNKHNTYVNAPFLGQFRQGSGHRMKFQVHSPLGNNLALSLSLSLSPRPVGPSSGVASEETPPLLLLLPCHAAFAAAREWG